jgi:hypothetical protein
MEMGDFPSCDSTNKSGAPGGAIGGSADLSVVRQVGWRYTHATDLSQGKNAGQETSGTPTSKNHSHDKAFPQCDPDLVGRTGGKAAAGRQYTRLTYNFCFSA